MSLLNHQRQYVDRFRAMSSALRPRQVLSPPPTSSPRPFKSSGQVSLPVATVSVKPLTFEQGHRAGIDLPTSAGSCQPRDGVLSEHDAFMDWSWCCVCCICCLVVC